MPVCGCTVYPGICHLLPQLHWFVFSAVSQSAFVGEWCVHLMFWEDWYKGDWYLTCDVTEMQEWAVQKFQSLHFTEGHMSFTSDRHFRHVSASINSEIWLEAHDLVWNETSLIIHVSWTSENVGCLSEVVYMIYEKQKIAYLWYLMCWDVQKYMIDEIWVFCVRLKRQQYSRLKSPSLPWLKKACQMHSKT